MFDMYVELAGQMPWLAFVLLGIFAALIGSFLNVVVHRLPIMMQRQWQQECEDYLVHKSENTQAAQSQPEETYNLIVPGSRCPQCQAAIKPWHNIPVFGWLWLRGKCAACQAPISARYPMVELVTAILAMVVVWQLGFTGYALACVFATFLLISLTLIDADTYLLPDPMNYLLLWGGLLANLMWGDLHSAVLGAVFGYLALWSVYWLFKLATGKEGMGFGDFKLLAALGAWVGWQGLPLIILGSSLVGAVIGIGMIIIYGRDKQKPMPFGPYLAIAGWITLLWGEQITQWYLLNMVG